MKITVMDWRGDDIRGVPQALDESWVTETHDSEIAIHIIAKPHSIRLHHPLSCSRSAGF